MTNIGFEIKILDEDLSKIGFWKFKKKDAAKFLRIINFKYDLGITVKENKKECRDLDWAK